DLFSREDFADIHITADTQDPLAAQSAARSLIDGDANITHIIDLSALYDERRSTDDNPSAKVAFYQTLVGALDDVAILYVTKGLHAFRSHEMSLAGAKFVGLAKMLSADYRHVDARTLDI